MYKPLFQNKFKIVFIGDSSVGKTSILNTYMKKNYTPKATLGTEFTEKYMENYDITLQIWDCAGQERFRALTRLYYRSAHICIMVFDLSKPETLKSIKDYWIYAVKTNSDGTVRFILVGNKMDLTPQIDYQQVWDLCKLYNMTYVETSAVNDTNISNIFTTACSIITDKTIGHLEYNDTTNTNDIIDIDESSNVDLYNPYSYYC